MLYTIDVDVVRTVSQCQILLLIWHFVTDTIKPIYAEGVIGKTGLFERSRYTFYDIYLNIQNTDDVIFSIYLISSRSMYTKITMIRDNRWRDRMVSVKVSYKKSLKIPKG